MDDEGSPPPAEPAEAGAEVDIQVLADKVYRLMVNEIRLGLARGEPVVGRRTT